MLHIARKRGDYSVDQVVTDACKEQGVDLEIITNDVR